VLDDRRIDSLYSRFLAQCTKNPTQEAQARRLLQIIIAATRPMTVTELDYALSVQASDKSLRISSQICILLLRITLDNSAVISLGVRAAIYILSIRSQEASSCSKSLQQTIHVLHLGRSGTPLIQQLPMRFLGRSVYATSSLSTLKLFQKSLVTTRGATIPPGTDSARRIHSSSMLRATGNYISTGVAGPYLAHGEKSWLLRDTRTLRFWTWFYIADHRWALKAATETTVAYYFPLGVFLRTMNQLNGEPSSLEQGSPMVSKV